MQQLRDMDAPRSPNRKSSIAQLQMTVCVRVRCVCVTVQVSVDGLRIGWVDVRHAQVAHLAGRPRTARPGPIARPWISLADVSLRQRRRMGMALRSRDCAFLVSNHSPSRR